MCFVKDLFINGTSLFQDYFDIVKKPMDLSTIRRKLDTGQYTDPWQYCDDVWLMFDNAWLYNRKTSRVYKYSSKVTIESFHIVLDLIISERNGSTLLEQV